MRKLLYLFALTLFSIGAKAQDLSASPFSQETEATLHPYIGLGYTARSLGGLTLTVGTTYQRHDLQLSYTFGLTQSDPVYWYDDAGIWLSTMTYRQNTFAVRYGYSFAVDRQFAVTPQLGYCLNTLGKAKDEGLSYGDGAKASGLAIAAKLQYHPLSFLSVFVAPEYVIALSQDTYYKHTAAYSDYSADGISVSVGLLFTF